MVSLERFTIGEKAELMPLQDEIIEIGQRIDNYEYDNMDDMFEDLDAYQNKWEEFNNKYKIINKKYN